MITIDITMVIQIINILILIGVLNVVLYKPVRTILQKREEKVALLGKEIDTFHQNATLRQEEIDRKIHDARVKAKEQMDAALSSGQTTGAETIAKFREIANETKASELNEIQQDFTKAHTELKAQVNGFASEIAGKILGRSV